jgi:uncharacterized lipoprotein YddW (UPF0748 family)
LSALAVGLALTVSAICQPTAPPELRGWWADTFHAALRNPAEVERLVADARAGNFNAVFVEVRKRGDAYYDSRFEPQASDVQAGFDPLAYLIERAHNTNAGPRLEVHAWIVTYNIWNRQLTPPSQTNHPYLLHPDWLTESFAGEKWDGSNYAFDPGHPAVQEHTFNVAMDLVTRYDLDGLHLDYIRYAGRDWGYNPVAVARFNAATGSADRPAPDDSGWMQWRRDQVTALVRRVYLAAAAKKPAVKISAATITWTPTATTLSNWIKTAAWSEVLQDWRGWMEEGILDINIPMAYFRHETHATAWAEWSRFAKQNRFQRHVALGAGGYLNTISNTVVQMQSTRAQVSGSIPKADGVLVYSYAAPAKDNAPRSDFITALTTPTAGVPNPPFANAALPPALPWKTNRSVRGISGVITDATTGQPIAGAQVELTVGRPHFLRTDANGAFCELLPFTPLNAVVSAPGYVTEFHGWTTAEGPVVATNFALVPDTSAVRALDLRVTPGRRSVVVNWRTAVPARGRVIYGLGAVAGSYGGEVREARPDTRHSVLVGTLTGGATDDPTECWLRVVNDSAEHGTNYSHAIRIVPAMWPAYAASWDARLTGNWDRIPYYPQWEAELTDSYWRTPATPGSPTATATWSAPIEVSGHYDVEYFLIGNSTARGNTYEVRTPRTNFTVKVTQSAVSGTLATNLFLLRGERSEVKLDNQATGQTYVTADRVFWRYRDGQDPPPADTLPVWWAEHFFTETTNARDDVDEDGFSNYAEFAFGTDPTYAESRLRLRLEPSPDGGWRMVFSPKVGGRAYVIEHTADLGLGDWEELPIQWPWPELLDSGEWSAPVPVPGTGPRFYRVRVKPN